MPKIKMFTVALASACVTLLLILCCGDDRGNADAQPTTTCNQWEVSTFNHNSTDCTTGYVPDVTSGESCTIPAGWEPFANYGDSGRDVYLRRCVR
jgi:hypothetical protein